MYIFPPDMKSAKLAARGVEKGKQGRILNFRKEGEGGKISEVV